MSKTDDDLLREPSELIGVLDRLTADGGALIEAAVRALDPTAPILVVGIGSSYNAAVAVAKLFEAEGLPAFAADASELLHFGLIPKGVNAIVLSRSGRSVEVVRLLDRLAAAEARTIAVTNAPDSPLALGVGTVAPLSAAFDHNVSFTMYTGLGLAGGLIAARAGGGAIEPLAAALRSGLEAAAERMDGWARSIAASPFLEPDAAPTYFLGRGCGLATCLEARLLWEEVAKAPASALPTGGFRHGSQEFVRPGVRVGLWLDPDALNAEDKRLVADLGAEGASVMCVGADLGGLIADLALEVPSMPRRWQFLVDVVPAQLAAVRLAALRGEDPDTFRFCSFVVEGEAGLGGGGPPRAQ